MSTAARYSCIQHSTVVRRLWQDFDDFRLPDEASLDPSRPWHAESLTLSLQAFRNGAEATRIRNELRAPDPTHKTLYQVARGDDDIRRNVLTTVLLRRAARWTQYEEDNVQGLYALAAHRPPLDLTSSVLRTVLVLRSGGL